MRVMVLVKASRESEAGDMPATEELEAMGRYNEELANAEVMLAGEGLAPSSRGKRVEFDGPSGRRVVDGPFTPPEELLAGFWIWQVESMDEAVEWAKRTPFQEGTVEIRQVLEQEDFGEELTPELREQERRLRAQVEQSG